MGPRSFQFRPQKAGTIEMIVDRVENAHLYFGIDPHIDTALGFIQEHDLEKITQLILDDYTTIKCMEYLTRPSDNCNRESHRMYADIHVCLKGVEVFGYCNRHDATARTTYDTENDKQFFDAKMNYIRLLPGMFVLTLTDDVHSAMMADGDPAPAQKAIIKCRLIKRQGTL